MLVHVEIPGMSLNLQDPLLRLTGIHPRQTGGIPIGQVFTDCARDGGVRPIRLPGSGTGLKVLCLGSNFHVSETFTVVSFRYGIKSIEQNQLCIFLFPLLNISVYLQSTGKP